MNPAEKDDFKPLNPRYARIEALNQKSFLMTEGSSLQVIQSLHSAGAPRDVLTPELAHRFDDEVIQEAHRVGRRILAGNISPLGYGPADLGIEARLINAQKNLKEFLDANDINSADIRMLRPERDYTTSLKVINVDEAPLVPDPSGLLCNETRGDMLYTYDPEIILAARPADCPIAFVTAETPKGPVTILLHLATLGVAHGYIDQAKAAMDELGVDWMTVRVQLTPGGHAETYIYENFPDYNPLEKFPEYAGMYKDVEAVVGKDGQPAYNFGVDVAAEAYEQIAKVWEIDPYQMYLDVSDTSAPNSGYSSQTRAFKNYAVEGYISRDIFLARHI